MTHHTVTLFVNPLQKIQRYATNCFTTPYKHQSLQLPTSTNSGLKLNYRLAVSSVVPRTSRQLNIVLSLSLPPSQRSLITPATLTDANAKHTVRPFHMAHLYDDGGCSVVLSVRDRRRSLVVVRRRRHRSRQPPAGGDAGAPAAHTL